MSPRKHSKLAADGTCPPAQGGPEPGCPCLLPVCNLPSPGIGVTLESGGQRGEDTSRVWPHQDGTGGAASGHLPGMPVLERAKTASSGLSRLSLEVGGVKRGPESLGRHSSSALRTVSPAHHAELSSSENLTLPRRHLALPLWRDRPGGAWPLAHHGHVFPDQSLNPSLQG